VTRRLVITTVAVATAALVSGCSSGSSGGTKDTGAATASTVDGVQQITVSAGDDFRFDPATITVHPGKVKITLVNTGAAGQGAPHNLQLPSLPAGDWVPLTSAGQSASVTFETPAPGTYQFVCSIHERQGQVGKLVVLPN
jgi:plastocyanin